MAAGRKTGGRVKGVPNRATADIKALAMEYTAEAFAALIGVVRDTESDAAKVAAIKEIFDRGFGKAKQSVDVDANVTAAITEIRRTIVRPRHSDT